MFAHFTRSLDSIMPARELLYSSGSSGDDDEDDWKRDKARRCCSFPLKLTIWFFSSFFSQHSGTLAYQGIFVAFSNCFLPKTFIFILSVIAILVLYSIFFLLEFGYLCKKQSSIIFISKYPPAKAFLFHFVLSLDPTLHQLLCALAPVGQLT